MQDFRGLPLWKSLYAIPVSIVVLLQGQCLVVQQAGICAVREQGPPRALVGQSAGPSNHITCTGVNHSPSLVQVKHALCHLPDHKYKEKPPRALRVIYICVYRLSRPNKKQALKNGSFIKEMTTARFSLR